MFNAKKDLILAASLLVVCALMPASDAQTLGGITPISGEDLVVAEQTLNNSLNKLAAGEGPNYKLSKIISATSQIVSGVSYTYVVELIDADNKTKQCNVRIWSQSWKKDGIEVTFECDGEEKIVKKHSA